MKVLAFLCLMFASHLADAGAGVNLLIQNHMTPNQADNDYPQVTLHNYAGSDCWYDYGLSDWNQYAKPNNSVSIYTERSNRAGTCNLQSEAVRGLGFYVKEGKDQPWVLIKPAGVLSNKDNIRQNFKVTGLVTSYDTGICPNQSYPSPRLEACSPPEGWTKVCGMVIPYTEKKYDPPGPRNTPNRILQFWVFGEPDLENCKEAEPTRSQIQSNSSTETHENEIKITIPLGQSRQITLSKLDSESEWELDQCHGDSASLVNVDAHHTKRKTLPETLDFSASKRGVTTCDVTAWHYPERNRVITNRYILTVN
jgi:hypothetical protein